MEKNGINRILCYWPVSLKRGMKLLEKSMYPLRQQQKEVLPIFT
jgi:hypothetical protein